MEPVTGKTKRAATSFPIFLIKPSHYDDDGYVIRWLRSTIPSNSLAAVYGLIEDAARRQVLGDGMAIDCFACDETNTRVDVEGIIRRIRQNGGRGLVGLVGVQSNQFPRAMDLARRFRADGVAVVIGGFHVSGSLAMLPGIQPEMQEALDLGISLFAGESEGRIDGLLRDAAGGCLKPIYDYLEDLPDLAGAPIPFLPRAYLERSIGIQSSLDAGRGCPFKCSFCTIINVQGRTSRRRSADDIEAIVRANAAQGVKNYFITDDNFARNADWELIFDRLIQLRERDGLKVKFTLQVDTLCHKLPGFIAKAARAGANKVFIGLENINPEALVGAQKRQNKVSDYRRMMQEWHSAGVLIFAGYIIGFPGDTPETIVRDIKIIQRELPVDFLEFFILTPLPGSQDHKALFDKGAALDPDLNNYDLFHVTADHPAMSRPDWMQAYRLAWETYYTSAHIEALFRRAMASGIPTRRVLRMAVWFAGTVPIEGVHPLDGGYFRLKSRDERRAGRPRQGRLAFHLDYWRETAVKHWKFAALIARLLRIERRVTRTPWPEGHADLALRPACADDIESLEMFVPSAARNAAAREHLIRAAAE